MENIHQGHREKMRQRFLKSGLEGFADHEALELLLSHKGENKRGQLTATLELWEYIPQTITAKSSSSSGSGKSGGGAASNLKADYKSYLSNERGKSPARDDADATAAMNKVTAMPY